MADISRIKHNVSKMVSMGAPMSDIDGYIASEGATIDDVKNFRESSKNPIQTGIDTAIDAIRFPIYPKMQEQASSMYGNEREKVLNTDLLENTRKHFSENPILNKNFIPESLAPISPALKIAEMGLQNISPKEFAKQAEGVAFDTLTGIPADLALAKGPALLSRNIIEPISNALEEAGGRFLNFYIKPRQSAYSFGRNPGAAVAKYIGPTSSRESLLSKVISKKDELLNSLRESASKSTSYVDATPIFEEISSVIDKMNELPNTYDQQIQSHINLAKDMANLLSKNGKMVNGRVLIHPQSAIDIKRALGELPSWASNDPKLGSITKTARKAYGRFDKQIDLAIPGGSEANFDISNLIGAEKGIELGAQREQNKDPLRSLSDMVSLGIGGTIGGVPGAAAGYATSRVLKSAPFNTTVGSIAGKVAKSGRTTSKLLQETERAPILQEAFNKLKGYISPRDLEVVDNPRFYSGPDLLERNRMSEVSRQIPDFSGGDTIEMPGRGPAIPLGENDSYLRTGNLPSIKYPGIEPRKPNVIQLPDYVESDFPKIAEKFGIKEFRPTPRSTTSEFPNVPRRDLPNPLKKLLKRRGIK